MSSPDSTPGGFRRLRGSTFSGTEPRWPGENGCRVVFLLDASSALETRMLRQWIEDHRPPETRPGDVDAIPIPPSRRRRSDRHIDSRLEARLAAGDDPLLAPLRVAWLQDRHHDGERAATLRHVFFGDPRDPNFIRQRWVLRRSPQRCRIISGEPATLSDLRRRWRGVGGTDVGETTGLPEFVARQAALALERAERQTRGSRYKVPRLVSEDILSRPAFRGAIARLARQLGHDDTSVMQRAARNLREIAAAHSPTMIDLATQLFRLMYSQGYKSLRYDRDRLEAVAALSQRHPVVFLPTHKSNVDHPVLHVALYENGLPPNHTAGGINMNFFPIGPLVRRAGVFFIRRSFKGDEIYKLVLHHYIDYLIEKRFSLEWYLEGGRSRSGKLLPPRFGLLAYVVDAYRRGKSEDVYLIPVSIAYDQIQDVGEYVVEQRGGAKERESLGWFLRVVRRLRRRYGDVHIRFGEPLSLASVLGPADPSAEPDPDERSLEVQKIAFEVSFRMNAVTPITPTSLVTLALLGAGNRALALGEVLQSLRYVVDYVRRRNLPTTTALDLDTRDGVQRVLDALVGNDTITCFAEGSEPVYMIADEQQLAAAYYRNTISHFFVTGAIAELALLRAAEEDVADRRAELIEAALRLRDLLKFEFFFADRTSFREDLLREIAVHDPGWESAVESGPAEIRASVRRIRPFSAHRVLRPFLDAYRVVADALVRLDPSRPLEESAFLSRCLSLGKQYALQRRIRSGESISKALFQTGLRLAGNRGLVEPGGDDLLGRRRAFAAEIADVLRRIDAIEALALARRSGLDP